MNHVSLVCQSCGAPARPGIVTCEFCEQFVSAEAARTAIACPQCRTANAGQNQQCLKCQAWLVVRCVFCERLSPYTSPACVACNEPFAGAMERKAQRESEIKRQQMLQTVGAVAPIAGGLLGGVAGALLGGSGHGYGGHRHYGSQGYGGHHYGGYHSSQAPSAHRMGESFDSDWSPSQQSSSSGSWFSSDDSSDDDRRGRGSSSDGGSWFAGDDDGDRGRGARDSGSWFSSDDSDSSDSSDDDSGSWLSDD